MNYNTFVVGGILCITVGVAVSRAVYVNGSLWLALFVGIALIAGGGILLWRDVRSEEQHQHQVAVAAAEEKRRREEDAAQKWSATLDQAGKEKLQIYLGEIRNYVLLLKHGQDNTRILAALHQAVDQLRSDEDITDRHRQDGEVVNEAHMILHQLRDKGYDEDMATRRLVQSFPLLRSD